MPPPPTVTMEYRSLGRSPTATLHPQQLTITNVTTPCTLGPRSPSSSFSSFLK
ncbi:hypothetical protein B0H19DRAFT_1158315 [Mycena capillaripes]|nr:hypothetical protein B0H19DRAFT_1201695 [Mycena capillaripes]KAJ6541948.1 hypothetical protein B0H19DRAFT_1175316 [Mycena capillaripes]KAJ6545788.1 hypothetical protein B0H19DRAFT_1168529 [Mycena capillaripes]KAJ6551623.1 hypothetical protein B0H19DRAFT_1158315 [Mycena capillaripes]